MAAGRLHRVHRGVYAVGHDGPDARGRWLAAVKACGPDAMLSHSSSVMLFELWPVEDRRPEVTVPRGQVRAPAHPGPHGLPEAATAGHSAARADRPR